MIKIAPPLTSSLLNKSSASERKRVNYNFHEHHEPINRFLNALQPETYCRPHKHQNPDKFEVFLIFSGQAAILEFKEDGEISDIFILDPATGNFGVEIAPRVWHTIVCLKPDTLCYEIKEGPYDPESAKYFADFAPMEGSGEAQIYLKTLKDQLNTISNK